MNGFKIKMQLPSLNDFLDKVRQHRKIGNSFKKNIENDIGIFITMSRNTLRPVQEYPCCVFIIWHEKSRKRDVDNVQSAQKFILDALVKRKILLNDNPNRVANIYHQIEYGKDDYVEVYLLEGKSRLEINI
jgi:Holliday junction resolvase RusA-like endonuclease